jgi:hypothetical protein
MSIRYAVTHCEHMCAVVVSVGVGVSFTSMSAVALMQDHLKKFLLGLRVDLQAGFCVGSMERHLHRLVQNVFKLDQSGQQEVVALMPAWVDEFNSLNGGANGRATLHTQVNPRNPGQPELHAITVVFEVRPTAFVWAMVPVAPQLTMPMPMQPSVRAFLDCSVRVLDVDAAFLEKSRKDLRYFLIEGHNSNNQIYPLAFHLGFRESTNSYVDFFTNVLDYSDELRAAIDSLDTRINGDRHSGLRAAIERCLTHGAQIFYNDVVHLLRNVRANTRVKRSSNRSINARQKEVGDGVYQKVDAFVWELSRCTNHALQEEIFGRLRVVSPECWTYLYHNSDKQWWIPAYFDRVILDGGHVTSNGAEQENGEPLTSLCAPAMLALRDTQWLVGVGQPVARHCSSVECLCLVSGEVMHTTHTASSLLVFCCADMLNAMVELVDRTIGKFLMAATDRLREDPPHLLTEHANSLCKAQWQQSLTLAVTGDYCGNSLAAVSVCDAIHQPTLPRC